MKKIIIGFVVLCFICGNLISTNSFANELSRTELSKDEDKDNIDLRSLVPWEIQYLQYLNETKKDESTTLGIGFPEEPEEKILSIDKIYQAGEFYSGDIMRPCGESIGESGCILTCFTMLVNYKNGQNYTPRDVNNKIGGLACPFDWSGVGGKYGLKARYVSKPTPLQAASIIFEQIRKDNPVIVFADRPEKGHECCHAYLVKGFEVTEQNDLILIVNDPGTRSTSQWTKDIYAHRYIHKVCYYE